ncbi:hypothetical protein OESDEN_25491 [Oesophagostomum dentatum]|uniref:Uncharacterized protein n=1 Tax=Oesophagostomum dentatum TaxID=61180 RepID=A0A0B1RPB3_OESDE|nr:hypothetical protein OESDEN_25491 [Oesophagostomum dentatum]
MGGGGGLFDSSCTSITSCREELYQWNALTTAKRVTYWNPLIEGMNRLIVLKDRHVYCRLKVTIDTPAIFIMLSRDPYPEELQCKRQRSSDNGTKMHRKSGEPRSAPRRGGRKQQQGSNKWSRPTKEAKEAEAAERQELIQKLEKLP